MEKLNKKNQAMLIRFDDIAPNMNWKFMNECEKILNEYNIKPLLGVIPKNEDPELLALQYNSNFWNKIEEWQKKGWEISAHGYTHVYDTKTNKKDYFRYGGGSEFFGHDLQKQKTKIYESLKIFSEKGIEVRSFFAPNHTYDLNTFQALRENGIKFVIDGYGLFPYQEHGIIFIPQLFYKEILLPYGIQSTQIHLNFWDQNNLSNFKKFIAKNYKKIVSFNEASSNLRQGLYTKIINTSVKISLKTLRKLRQL